MSGPLKNLGVGGGLRWMCPTVDGLLRRHAGVPS